MVLKGFNMDNEQHTSQIQQPTQDVLYRKIKLASYSDSAQNRTKGQQRPTLWKRCFARKKAQYSGEYSIFYYMYKSLFLCYFSIKGRASRKEFWALTLLTSLLNMLCFYYFYVQVEDYENLLTYMSWISRLTFIPGITVIIRRVHDFGKSGWWLFVPTYKIIFFAFIKGDKGENAFGVPE